jgi:hypothetical protein
MDTKTDNVSSRRANWVILLTILALLSTIVLSACDSGNPTPTIVASTATPAATEVATSTGPLATTTVASISTPISTVTIVPPQAMPFDITSSTNDIAKDVGKVTEVFEGDPGRNIVLFEETHASPAGQIEIAIMLNRLYERYGLRSIGLEGAFAIDGRLQASWFQNRQGFGPGSPVGPREDVLVQFVEEGEISSSEMMAVMYGDVVVIGIEKAEEYNYDITDEAANSPIIYLYNISAPGMTQAEISKFNSLVDEDKVLEAVEFAIGTDAWASAKYEQINDETDVISAETWIEIADELKEKADQVGADIPSEDEAALRDLRKFFEVASQRTDTMVKNTLELLKQSPDAPIAMITGAAHTEKAARLLKESGVSFSVVMGNSLANNSKNGDLHNDAYDRKTKSQSVGTINTLGALLDGRKKPPVVINQRWAQVRAVSHLMVDEIALALQRGELAPFKDTLSRIQAYLDEFGITVDTDTFEEIDGYVLFSYRVAGVARPIWVRARADKNAVDLYLNNLVLGERLTVGLKNVQEKPEPDNTKPEGESEGLKPISITTRAKFGHTREAVLSEN